jgi:hypothetical protein
MTQARLATNVNAGHRPSLQSPGARILSVQACGFRGSVVAARIGGIWSRSELDCLEDLRLRWNLLQQSDQHRGSTHSNLRFRGYLVVGDIDAAPLNAELPLQPGPRGTRRRPWRAPRP